MGWTAGIEIGPKRQKFFVAGADRPKNEAKLSYKDAKGKQVTVQTGNGQAWAEVPDDVCPAGAIEATVG